MSIHSIVHDYLLKHGYDGLAGDECGCEIDDLMPCDCPDMNECVPGRWKECGECFGKGVTGVMINGDMTAQTCDLCGGRGKLIMEADDDR